MTPDGLPVERDPASLLGRMRDEISFICAHAPEVWERCLAQAEAPSERPSALVLTGCGDSYYAGLAVRSLLEDLTGLPTLVWPAMEVVTVPSLLLSGDALLVGVSVSGKVGRTIEAVAAHAARDGRTVAVTAFAESRLAATTDAAVVTGVTGTPGPVPGTSTYVASLLGLMSIGVALAQPGRAADANRDVLRALRLLPDSVAAAERFAADVAVDLKEPFFVVGTGADAGTAHYAAAKFLEAAGLVGVASDLEEWAHEQYFATDASRTLLMSVTDERLVERAGQVAAMARSVEGRVAAVGSPALGPAADIAMTLPSVGAATAPLLAWLPFALAALHFSRGNCRFPFGTDRANRMSIADRSIYAPGPPA